MSKKYYLIALVLIVGFFSFQFHSDLNKLLKTQVLLNEEVSPLPPLAAEEDSQYSLNDRYQYEIIDKEDDEVFIDASNTETLEVGIKNIGKSPWYLHQNYENKLVLKPYSPDGRHSVFSEDSIEIMDEDGAKTIDPGSVLTFEFELNAPENAGYYHECFAPQVLNYKWLNNEKLCWDIVVEDDFETGYNYEISSTDTQKVIPTEGTKTINLKIKNSGKAPWYKENNHPVKLVSDDENYEIDSQLEENMVNEGEFGNFSFDVVSPGSIGSHQLKLKLIAEDLYDFEPEINFELIVTDHVVALTFDDGYGDAGEFVDVLNKEGVRGTFFMLGVVAQNQPDTMKRIVNEGHLLANHSYNHPDFRTLSSENILSQIESTRQIMLDITGYDVYPYFRYPYGAKTAHTDAVIEDAGWQWFHWTNGTGDFNYHENSAQGRQHVYYYATLNPPDKAIVLMHIISRSTLAVLPDIIKFYRDNGYAFVTVDEL